jgi:AraC-like DNA-binding protein
MSYQNATPSEVVEVQYEPRAAGLPLETFTLASLVQRRSAAELAAVQRLEFELLVWCTAGSGHHEVDFELVELSPARILHVRPGQVHRWMLDPPCEAQLFVLRALDQRGDWRPGPHVIAADEALRRDLENIVALVDHQARATPLSLRSLEAVRDLLVALLGLGQAVGERQAHREVLYRDFQRLLAEAEPPVRTVQDCARVLGCSARTLNRACAECAGAKPKVLLDRAVGLEAQRRLSERGATATTVAESLGFGELSHFTRFFTRVTGETPSAFVASFGRSGVGA